MTFEHDLTKWRHARENTTLEAWNLNKYVNFNNVRFLCWKCRIYVENSRKYERWVTPAPAAWDSSTDVAPTEQSLYRRNAACKHVRSGDKGGLQLAAAAHASTSPHKPPPPAPRSPPAEGKASREDAPFKTMTQGWRGNERGGGDSVEGKKEKRSSDFRKENLDQTDRLPVTGMYSRPSRCHEGSYYCDLSIKLT